MFLVIISLTISSAIKAILCSHKATLIILVTSCVCIHVHSVMFVVICVSFLSFPVVVSCQSI